jgi:hypothetical protein
MFTKIAQIAKQLDSEGKYEEANYLTDIMKLAASGHPTNVRLAESVLDNIYKNSAPKSGIDAYNKNKGGFGQKAGAGLDAWGKKSLDNGVNAIKQLGAPVTNAYNIYKQTGGVNEGIGAGADAIYRKLKHDAGTSAKVIEELSQKIGIPAVVNAFNGFGWVGIGKLIQKYNPVNIGAKFGKELGNRVDRKLNEKLAPSKFPPTYPKTVGTPPSWEEQLKKIKRENDRIRKETYPGAPGPL